MNLDIVSTFSEPLLRGHGQHAHNSLAFHLLTGLPRYSCLRYFLFLISVISYIWFYFSLGFLDPIPIEGVSFARLPTSNTPNTSSVSYNQLNSDTVYVEMASDPMLRVQCHKTVQHPHFGCQLQAHVVTCASGQLAIQIGSSHDHHLEFH